MERACFTTWAELLHFKTIWIVTTILLGDVVAFFALYAGHSDFWANIRALAGHRRTPLLMSIQVHTSQQRREGYRLGHLLWKLRCQNW